jgi:hypothetical protein
MDEERSETSVGVAIIEVSVESFEVASHRDGAVARKNLSLSRWAMRSCSWWLSGRLKPTQLGRISPDLS